MATGGPATAAAVGSVEAAVAPARSPERLRERAEAREVERERGSRLANPAASQGQPSILTYLNCALTRYLLLENIYK